MSQSLSAVAFIDMSFSALKTLWGGRAAQPDLEDDSYTSAGATVPTPLMTSPSTIPRKRRVTASSSSSESSPHQSKPPPTRRRLFIAESFKPINLPKSLGKSIGKSNVKSMPIRRRECGDLGLEKYVS